jgi:methanol corrinoid protein
MKVSFSSPTTAMSADAMLEGIEFCKENSEAAPVTKGTVVCHVAEGDVHDIGKNIVLLSSGQTATVLSTSEGTSLWMKLSKQIAANNPIKVTGNCPHDHHHVCIQD